MKALTTVLFFLLNISAMAQLPLGTFRALNFTTMDCPAGFVCQNFVVTVPNVAEAIRGTIADQKPAGTVNGVVVFFAAGDGKQWWDAKDPHGIVASFFQSLLNSGYELIQVKWRTSWLEGALTKSYGEELLACRPATVIQWIHDNYPAPKLVVTGQSGGGSAVAYALTSYGLAPFIKIAIFTSGPPMAAISKGCLQVPGYSYSLSNARTIDLSYGYNAQKTGIPGPCELHDAAFSATWVANSVETCGTIYYYGSTRITFIEGGDDKTGAVNHATDYFNVLAANQQPMLTWTIVPTMPHLVTHSQEGLDALLAAVEQ